MSTSEIPVSSSTPEGHGKNTGIFQETDGNREHAVASRAGCESLETTHNASSERDEHRKSQEVADRTAHGKTEQQDTAKDSSGMMEFASTMDSSANAKDSREDSLPEQVEKLSLSPQKPGPLRVDNSLDVPPPPPPKKDDAYLDPPPKIPLRPQSPARSVSDFSEKELPDVPRNGELDEKEVAARDGGKGEDSQAEIQSIMEQFSDDNRNNGKEEIMSPRLEFAEQLLGGPTHFPPRKSSLEPIKTADNVQRAVQQAGSPRFPPPLVPPKPSPRKAPVNEGPMTPRSPSSVKGPPPPEPEPDQPFDFHRFLEQLRHRTADPVAKFLRSFLHEFGKRQWMVHEQVKIISDFLEFITNKMAQCEVWKNVSEAEFDNAKEGMEKLVMNRLYSQTFSPAIPPPPTPTGGAGRGKRRELEKQGPWRRGQHQEDVERDEILAQKIRIYSWVREEHLDIPPVGPQGRRFLNLAQQELLKIKGYRAPRDKVICIMNCCKVIFGLLRNSKNADTSADSFVPLLIYVVLQANPENLVSNVQYILRFRNPEKLGGETGYYLSSLSGAIQFIETLDRTSLTVSDEEFERNVEAAVSAIAERNREAEAAAQLPPNVPDKSAPSGSEATPRGSLEGERYSQRGGASQSSDEDNAPVAGLLRTIQKPLSTIGRIFSDEPSSPQERPVQPAAPPRLSPGVYQPPCHSSEERRLAERQRAAAQQQQARTLDAQEAAARQASAEAAEARRIQRAEHNDVVEILCGMFPNLDRDVIDDVLRMKGGRVGLAVDACLALSAE